MGKVVVLGSVNSDIVTYASRFPVDGETVFAKSVEFGPGGKGNNQATAAVRAGADVCFISKVGGDMLSNVVIDHLKNEGLSAEYVFVSRQEQTGCAVIQVQDGGENRIMVIQGANGDLRRDEVAMAEHEIESCDVFLLQMEISMEAIIEGLRLAKEHEKVIILNPASVQPIPDGLFDGITYLTPNETEAEYYTGIPVNNLEDAERAAKSLMQMGAQHIIITLGRQGAFYCDDERKFLVPSTEMEAVDTVGAGDAFNGALAVALSENMEIENAIRFANCAAGLSVTKKGAAPAMPHREEVLALLEEKYGIAK